jgi:hypothetical protein
VPKLKTSAEKEAWSDGWSAAGVGAKQHDRQNYLTHGEREAFSLGWEERADRIAWERRDNAPLETPNSN